MVTHEKNNAQFDLAKTEVLGKLFSINHQKRQQAWYNKFQEVVLDASLQLLEPNVSTGPDGFNYLNLAMPEPNTPFQSFCISHVIPHCLEQGLGIALFLNKHNLALSMPEYVFSMGVLDGLHRHNSWVGKYDCGVTNNILPAGEICFTGQPGEEIIPSYTKKLIGNLLRGYGFTNPKIGNFYNEKVGFAVIINCRESNFANKDLIQHLCTQIMWLLTPGIAVTLLSETDSDDDLLSI